MKSGMYSKSIICKGTISFSGKNIQCLIDQSIVNYYYALIPKYYKALRPGRPAHVTIVREWENYDHNLAQRFIGSRLSFAYYPDSLKLDWRHFTIDCVSEPLQMFRSLLGLTPLRAPFNCFHFTVGYIDVAG